MIANIKSVRTRVVSVAVAALGWVALAGPASAAGPANGAVRAAPTSAQPRLEEFHLVGISPSENMVTLRGPDRKPITLKVGSTLVSARARLVEVHADRLRFDAIDDKGSPQTAWMFRSSNPDQELPQVKRSARQRT